MVRGSNPVGGEIFRTRPDRPCGPPSLLYNGYRVFPGVKRPGRGVDHPLPSSFEVKERVGIYFYSPSGHSWPVLDWTVPSLCTRILSYWLFANRAQQLESWVGEWKKIADAYHVKTDFCWKIYGPRLWFTGLQGLLAYGSLIICTALAEKQSKAVFHFTILEPLLRLKVRGFII